MAQEALIVECRECKTRLYVSQALSECPQCASPNIVYCEQGRMSFLGSLLNNLIEKRTPEMRRKLLRRVK